MFDQATLTDSHSAISSLESAFGATRFAVPDGGTTDLFGQVPVRANLSARQAKELGLMTSGTYGRISNGSSKSANLQSSLESKLQARLSMTGSTLYTLTWKPWVTPSGVSRSRLRASVRRTSETVTTGWLSPAASDGNGGKGPRTGVSPTGMMPDGSKVTMGLPALTKLVCGWPTPLALDHNASAGTGENPRDVPRAAALAGWATPAARDWTSASASAEFLAERLEQSRGKPLSEQAFTLAGWPTTSCNNDRTGNPESAMSMQRQDGTKVQQRLQDFAAICGPARLTATGVMLTGSAAGMDAGGQLNPAHSRWLQGLPPEWCQAAIAAYRLMPRRGKRG